MKKSTIHILCTLIFGLFSINGQQTDDSERMRNVRKFFKDIEDKAMAEEFVGVRTSKGLVENLFPIHSTGVSTIHITTAANNFLRSLDKEQLTRTTFKVDDPEWRK
ncbi:DUF3500 domain-containing protein [Maribacter litopenaei]|uniref:DUF3500 domain-containing protein n=1 Tax=Maribacter litopenaei TaxID=2976127 RepID=A0ABY5Y4T4_9FLAO|nr:DUF3500 domain-containing protein [Maribacter litopenaei]UWX53826.1 DUF3500 domain-containing protein [Maribacter litopenaei]